MKSLGEYQISNFRTNPTAVSLEYTMRDTAVTPGSILAFDAHRSHVVHNGTMDVNLASINLIGKFLMKPYTT